MSKERKGWQGPNAYQFRHSRCFIDVDFDEHCLGMLGRQGFKSGRNLSTGRTPFGKAIDYDQRISGSNQCFLVLMFTVAVDDTPWSETRHCYGDVSSSRIHLSAILTSDACDLRSDASVMVEAVEVNFSPLRRKVSHNQIRRRTLTD